MDSPHHQPSSVPLQRQHSAIISPTPARVPLQRSRTTSVLPTSVDYRGAVRKRTPPVDGRNRSISLSQAERLQNVALHQFDHQPHPPPLDLTPPTGGAALHWWTPQQSPQPGAIFTETCVESLPPWTFPTPPRSDSGVPSVSVDNNEDHPATTLSTDSGFLFEQPTSSAEMSSLGFLLPTHYGSGLYEEPNNYDMDASFIPPVRMSQSMGPPQGTGYSSTAPSSNPALYQSKGSVSSASANDLPRLNEAAHGQMDMPYRRATHLYESAPSHGYSMAGTPTIPSITDLTQSPMTSPHVGSSYPPSASRSPNMYDAAAFGQSYPSQPLVSHMYAAPGTSSQLNYGGYAQPAAHEANGKPSNMASNDASMRVLNERPKPRCWDHGCNGRQFSTFSNLLRHQREKSGSAQKSYCPKCGAVFTRTTARNGHVAHDKCTKQRRTSDGAKS